MLKDIHIKFISITKNINFILEDGIKGNNAIESTSIKINLTHLKYCIMYNLVNFYYLNLK